MFIWELHGKKLPCAHKWWYLWATNTIWISKNNQSWLVLGISLTLWNSICFTSQSTFFSHSRLTWVINLTVLNFGILCINRHQCLLILFIARFITFFFENSQDHISNEDMGSYFHKPYNIEDIINQTNFSIQMIDFLSIPQNTTTICLRYS